MSSVCQKNLLNNKDRYRFFSKSCRLSSDRSLGSWVAGASRRMLHPNGGSAESHPGPDADHEATQRQPRRLPEAQHAALQPRRAPRVTQVSSGINKPRRFCRRGRANEADFHLSRFRAVTSESVWSWTRMTKSVSATTSRWKSSASSWTRQRNSSRWRGQQYFWSSYQTCIYKMCAFN